jgi:tRNA(Ile)-lysidine synthase
VPVRCDLALIAHSTLISNDNPTRIAVAVSGGSDSTAVLHLMADVARARGIALFAVTVDHSLRASSADEAAMVAQVCAGLDVPHSVLVWQHGVVAGNLMDAARQARYGLMGDWARGLGISHIFLGHTADDQAETFLMGLARRAGIDGLVGMHAGWDAGGVRFVRPYLGATRADLRGYLTRRGMGWVDDPSNENEQFTRVKARRALTALQPLGITVEALASVMVNLSAAQGAVQQATHDAASMCREQAGTVVFEGSAWRAAGPEVQRRLLIAALRWVSSGAAPRGSGVDRVMAGIRRGDDTTLAGCRVLVDGHGFCVVREAAAQSLSQPGAIWDGRWQIDGPFVAGQHIGALGVGVKQCKNWRGVGVSRAALTVTPAVWQGDTLISAPIAGFRAGFDARIVAPFNQFVLSH